MICQYFSILSSASQVPSSQPQDSRQKIGNPPSSLQNALGPRTVLSFAMQRCRCRRAPRRSRAICRITRVLIPHSFAKGNTRVALGKNRLASLEKQASLIPTHQHPKPKSGTGGCAPTLPNLARMTFRRALASLIHAGDIAVFDKGKDSATHVVEARGVGSIARNQT